ncbi:hypothetical protein [Phormidium pseudopriestleyi]|nr:hypothetical protein [Phormidium pseudopriestleyi]
MSAVTWRSPELRTHWRLNRLYGGWSTLFLRNSGDRPGTADTPP